MAILITARSLSIPGPALGMGERQPRLSPGDNEGTGTIAIRVVDYPPHVVQASIQSRRGTSRAVTARVENERPLSADRVRAIKARQEACRGNVDDRTVCDMSDGPRFGPRLVPLSIAPGDLERSVRKSIAAQGATWEVVGFKCEGSGRCSGRFRTTGGDHRVTLTYEFRALEGLPRCWDLTAFSVIRPAPEIGSLAAPLPSRGCVDR